MPAASRPERSRFAFAPGLVLEVDGPPSVREHFSAEYGPRAAADGEEPGVAVRFGTGARAPTERYKSVSWRIELGDPAAVPLRAAVDLGGRPRSFAVSLLQGYLIEPLTAVGAARAGFVLLPSAAVETADGAVLLVGRSRTGKSSVCARALAAGRRILGDDHTLIDGEGRCIAFPRRLRVYADLARTAPDAFRRLPATARAALRARAGVKTVTRGYLAPPVRIPVAALGRSFPDEPLRLARVIAIDRDGDARALERRAVSLDALVDLAQTVADEQRVRLVPAADGASWRSALASARTADREVLLAGLGKVPAEAVLLPSLWGAARCVETLAGLVGVDG